MPLDRRRGQGLPAFRVAFVAGGVAPAHDPGRARGDAPPAIEDFEEVFYERRWLTDIIHDFANATFRKADRIEVSFDICD